MARWCKPLTLTLLSVIAGCGDTPSPLGGDSVVDRIQAIGHQTPSGPEAISWQSTDSTRIAALLAMGAAPGPWRVEKFTLPAGERRVHFYHGEELVGSLWYGPDFMVVRAKDTTRIRTIGRPTYDSLVALTASAPPRTGALDPVTTVDSTIRIPLKNGMVVEFVSNPHAEETVSRFTYVGHLERAPFHAVQASYYEATGVFLVHDSTGKKIGIDDMPVVSPSGELMVIASLDLQFIVAPNAISIVRITGDTIEKIWREEPQDWGPREAVWAGEDTVRFIRVWGIGERRSVPESPAMLVRGPGGWTLQGVVPDTLPEDTTEVH